MENDSLLNKIKSKHNIFLIFDFIKDNIFKYKLLIHSKKLQTKCDIKLDDYKELYHKILAEKYKIDIKRYLCYERKTENLYLHYYYRLDKDSLKKNLDNDICLYKIDKEKFDIIINYKLKEQEKEFNNLPDEEKLLKLDSELLINFNSPIFHLISQNKIFENIYSIPINIYYKELENDYNSFLDKLNESNIKYNSITLKYEKYFDLCNFKKFHIDYDKLKRLSILKIEHGKESDTLNIFMLEFFSIKNLPNNLIFLNLSIDADLNNKETKMMSQLNNFKSLKYLIINGIHFSEDDEPFILTLDNLIYLSLEDCWYMGLSDNLCSNIKQLKLFHDVYFPKLTSKLKFPQVVKCELLRTGGHSIVYDIDFSSFKKLKSFRGIIPDFLFINNDTQLEEVILDINDYRDGIKAEDEINALKKFIEIKTLKKIEIKLRLSKLKDDIEQIGENYSVQTLKILDNTSDPYNIRYLLKKYPNLTNLSVKTNWGGGICIIKEEPN